MTVAAPSLPPRRASWAARGTCAGARAAQRVRVRGGGANAFSSARQLRGEPFSTPAVTQSEAEERPHLRGASPEQWRWGNRFVPGSPEAPLVRGHPAPLTWRCCGSHAGDSEMQEET